MPRQAAIDKFFDAVDEAYDTALDTLKAGIDRGHRVSKGLIQQAQESQRDALQLAQTVIRSPTDFGNSATAVVGTLTKTQGHVLALSREWLDEAMDAQQEGRQTLRRLIDANRSAGEAVIEASRGLAGQAQERARRVVRPERDGGRPRAGETRRRRRPQTEETKTE